jgi:hypothetical protein
MRSIGFSIALCAMGCGHAAFHTTGAAIDLTAAAVADRKRADEFATPAVVAAPPAHCTVVGQIEGRDEGGSYVRAAEQAKAAARAAGVRTIAFGKHSRPSSTTVIVPATLLACAK